MESLEGDRKKKLFLGGGMRSTCTNGEVGDEFQRRVSLVTASNVEGGKDSAARKG